jgi:hypothetical protein
MDEEEAVRRALIKTSVSRASRDKPVCFLSVFTAFLQSKFLESEWNTLEFS